MRFRSGILLILVYLIFQCHPGQDIKESSEFLTGYLYVYGNEPFTNLALKTDEGKFYVVDPSQKEQFLSYQNKKVQVKCIHLQDKIQGESAIKILEIKIINE